jgi:hypothetical protein
MDFCTCRRETRNYWIPKIAGALEQQYRRIMTNHNTASPQGGWYDIGNRRVLGELKLDGERTAITFHDPEFFLIDDQRACIFGTLHDLKKISLIDCHGSGPGQRFGFGESRYVCDVIPHYVLIGDRHLDPADPAVKQVSLLIDDAEALFPDHDAFGRAFKPKDHIDALANDYETTFNRPLRRGPSPIIHFFGGESEIISVQTDIGHISVRHRQTHSMSQHSNDYGFKNSTWLEIEFLEAVSLHAAVERTGNFLRFIEILAGRPQNLERMEIYATEVERSKLEVHWLFRPRRSPEWENLRVSNIDLLINPISDRAKFETVLKNWLQLDPERKLPRCRASELRRGQRAFNPDRLVAAANMFDLLPDTALPPKPALSEDLIESKAAARALFKKLPMSDERTSVLQALGRIGTRTLRQKISHRAAIVNRRIHPKLTHLELVVSEAVTTRNYYVHGGDRNFDYDKYPGVSSFLTEALEFIFDASDLIDAGWDVQDWYLRMSALSHPFKLLVKRWNIETRTLQEVKEAAAASATDQ